jgi:integrase/recombinase XerD
MPKFTRARPGWNRSQEWFSAASFGTSADAFIRYLTERGYAEGTINSYFGSVGHFVHWLSRQRTGSREISEDWIERFLDRHLPHCRCAPACRRAQHEARAALRHFLSMLRASGTCPPPIPVATATALAAELAGFHRYLAQACGLSDSTCTVRLHHVRDFLADRFGTNPICISTLTPADVADFAMRYTQGWTPASIKTVGNSLRSYFRFKASQGTSTKALTAALPRVAQWRLAGLPEALSTVEIKLLLNAFDRQTTTGKRDYAIARCLLDLGLRRTEVAHLQLDDVDWRAGTLRIHGKGKRIDVLPLPRRTGQAIADYLRHGRPLTTRREVFVRHRPPVNAAADIDIVRNAIRYAAQRCGLQARIRGTHILRRTAACRMVQAGTPFKDIADLLRHRCLDTTAIYAKVDLPALRRVALPWPGRRS